jgi:hypothetical protein
MLCVAANTDANRGQIRKLEEMLMLKYSRLLIGIAMAAALAAPSSAQQAGGAKVGALTCNTSASIGFIVGSHQKIRCTFAPDSGAPPENYFGYINRVGLDLGVTTGGVMVWAVFAPTNGYHHGALAGTYGGASGSASVGVGVGANALVGGSGNTVALQPVSIEGNTGLNVAAGIAGVTLTPAP